MPLLSEREVRFLPDTAGNYWLKPELCHPGTRVEVRWASSPLRSGDKYEVWLHGPTHAAVVSYASGKYTKGRPKRLSLRRAKAKARDIAHAPKWLSAVGVAVEGEQQEAQNGTGI